MSFPSSSRMSWVRSKLVAGQGLSNSRGRGRSRSYCNYPDSNPEPNGQQPPVPDFPQQVPEGWPPVYVAGDAHYRAVNETNANVRRNEGYGERGRRPYYRGGGGNDRGKNNYNTVPYTYPSVNPGTAPRPLRAPPPDDHRHWQYALTQPSSQNERFIILSYNILADSLARDHRQQLYIHIPHYILDWDWRKRRILLELGLWSADIMCLQEVDKFQELQQELKQRGYSGMCKERTGIARDGCAIFWRTSRFELLHEEYIEYSKLNLRDNVAQICVLQSKFMGNAQAGASQSANSGHKPGAVNRVVICNIHVFFNPKRGEVKLGQVRVLLEQAQAVSKAWDNAPVVIVGDFNSTPKSPLYEFLSKNKLDISGLARNQISGQPGNQPNFGQSLSNRDVPDLAHLAGTILKSAAGNEMETKHEHITDSPNLTDNITEENVPKVFTDTPIKCQAVGGDNGSVSTGSGEDIFAIGLEGISKPITGSTMDAKVDYGKGVEESSVMYVSLSKTEQISQCLAAKGTVNMDTSETEKESTFSSPEVSNNHEKKCSNEFEGLQVASDGGTSEDCCMGMTSTRNHPLSIEQGVSAMNIREDQGKISLYSCSSKILVAAEGLTVSSNELNETNGKLYLQQTVKEDVRKKEEHSGLIISEIREYGNSSEPPYFVDGSNMPCQLQVELCSEGIEKEHTRDEILSQINCRHVVTDAEQTSSLLSGSVSGENTVESASCLLSKQNRNDIATSGGIGIIREIVSGLDIPLKNAQSSKAGPMDEEQTGKQSDQSSSIPRFGSTGLNREEALSMSLSGKNISNEEEEQEFINADEIRENPLMAAKDGINIDIDQPEQGLESTIHPSEFHSASVSDSNTSLETVIPPYDPYSWSPMEIEAATGKADCYLLQHNLKLRSTYTEVEDYVGTKDLSGEPLVTSYNRRFMGTVDYIWRTGGLQTVKVLDTLPTHILQRTRGFPTKKWGSDHLALACQLAFTSETSKDEDH